MIRMLIIGYCFGIRSERRLCEEAHLNLAYRWFCRLGLDGHVPDHSTFSKNRHGRFRESDLLRRVFEMVLQRCIREGLVGGETFAIDASLIKADANRQKGIDGEKGLPPEATGRAVEEFMAVLDDAAFGAATDVVPKFVSPADPAARWTGAHGGQAFFAYSTNSLIDVENAIIVDVEATTAIRQAEVLAAKRMVERSIGRFDLYPARLLGDSAYGSAEMLGWLVYEHGIEPHVTVFDKSTRQRTEWCARRVPSRSNRPKPPKARKANTDAKPSPSLRPISGSQSGSFEWPAGSSRFTDRLLQQNRPGSDVTRSGWIERRGPSPSVWGPTFVSTRS
jgi:IS5 family transposase